MLVFMLEIYVLFLCAKQIVFEQVYIVHWCNIEMKVVARSVNAKF